MVKNKDFVLKDMMFEIMKELNNAGTTIVLITHDSHVAECAGRVIEISEGKIK